MATKKSLEAAAATSGLFDETKGTRKPKRKPGPAAIPETKKEKATFSVKIDSTVLKKWRFYSSMNGYGDKGNMTEAALNEYMNRHKLSPEQQKKLETLMSL